MKSLPAESLDKCKLLVFYGFIFY